MQDRVALRLDVAAMTHVGQRRNINEDCIAVGQLVSSEPMPGPRLDRLALTAPVVCMVADGLGGHPSGHVASRLAIEQLIRDLPAAQGSDEALVAAIREVNRSLYQMMALDPSLTGMGTTIAGIAADLDSIAIFNVGDSRVYRIDRGRAEKVSVDHSESTAGALFAWTGTSRVLSQCLGGYPPAEEINPFVQREPAAVGTVYLICSDGLHDMLDDAQIAGCVGTDLEVSVAELFDQAMAAGGNDNISILLARIAMQD